MPITVGGTIGPGAEEGFYLPGPEGTNGDFWVGDTVTVHTGTGPFDLNEVRARVTAITISRDDDNGELIVIPELELLPPLPPTIEPYALLRRSRNNNPLEGERVMDVGFDHTGDDTGPYMPTVGPLTLVQGGPAPALQDSWMGVDFQGSGSIEFNSHWIWYTASAGYTVRIDVLLNGVAVASGSCVTGAAGCEFDIGTVGTPETLTVASGDQLRFRADRGQTGSGIYLDSVDNGFEITGGLLTV